MGNPKPLRFEHVMIDREPVGRQMDVCLIGDINGDGKNDIVIGGKRGEGNIVWYENPGWQRHTIGTAPLEAGGCLVDITGNGRLDLYVGNPADASPNTELYWFECPADPTQLWTKRVIANRFKKYHDQAAGDVDGDGEQELLFASQGSKVLGYFDIPGDPTIQPWPDHCLHVIAENCHVEGLAIADLDGDGENEVVAGPGYFKRKADGSWRQTVLAEDMDARTLTAVADVMGNGYPDILFSEGELDEGKVALFVGPDWKRIDLGVFFHPHTLEIADFDGDGKPDLLVCEMSLRKHAHPRQVVFRNLGNGNFAPEVVGNLAMHGGKAGDITGNGLPDIVGKPYDSGSEQVDLLINRAESAQD